VAEQPVQRRVTWGEFELDLRLRRLFRAGRRIRLQPIPLQILTLLVEQPGEVVTRDQLHHKIWNGYSYGDFDHSLNIAINKLRVALSDSAKQPRYIETLPQVGYRFLAPASTLDAGATPPKPAPALAQLPSTKAWAAAFLVVVALALGSWAWVRRGSSKGSLGSEEEAIESNLGAAPADRVAFVSAGPPGTAFRVTGTGADYVRVPNSRALQPETVTVSVWVRSNGSPGVFRYVAAKGALGCSLSSYALYTAGSGSIVFYVGNSGGIVASPAALPSVWDGKWHHVTGTFDGYRSRLYVDGSEIGEGTAAPPEYRIEYNLDNGNDLTLGAFVGTCTIPFSGEIGELEVFGRALPQEEVRSLFVKAAPLWRNHPDLIGLSPEPEALCAPSPPGLVAWWPGDGPREVVAGLTGGIEGDVFVGEGRVGPGLMLFRHGHVNVPSAPSLRVAGSLTLEAWVYFQGESDKNELAAPVAAKWADLDSGTVSYGLFVRPDGIPYLALSPDGASVKTLEGTLPLIVQFTHIAGVWDGSTMRLYVNGARVAAARFAGPLHVSDAPFTIGGLTPRSSAARESLAGVVDEVSLYNRALSENEIMAIYRAGSAGNAGGSGCCG